MENNLGSTLEVRNVTKRYGQKLVLDNISLEMKQGEICSLVGPSGCGKSTLLRLVLGQESPTTGSIIIDGQPAGYPDPSRGIVPQNYSLRPDLTVIGNVMLGKQLSMGFIENWKNRKGIREEVMYYLSQVRLADAADKFPYELSGGMKQRAAIAQALIMHPRILLMDEPFGALDSEVRERLQIFLLEMWDKFKMTILFITHDLEEAVFIGTRVTVLSQHYSEEEGKEPTPLEKRGARITFNYQLPPHALSTAVKKLPEFGEVLEMVREQFNPSNHQQVREFNRTRPKTFEARPFEEEGEFGF